LCQGGADSAPAVPHLSTLHVAAYHWPTLKLSISHNLRENTRLSLYELYLVLIIQRPPRT